jgi:hypothetical protein
MRFGGLFLAYAVVVVGAVLLLNAWDVSPGVTIAVLALLAVLGGAVVGAGVVRSGKAGWERSSL